MHPRNDPRRAPPNRRLRTDTNVLGGLLSEEFVVLKITGWLVSPVVLFASICVFYPGVDPKNLITASVGFPAFCLAVLKYFEEVRSGEAHEPGNDVAPPKGVRKPHPKPMPQSSPKPGRTKTPAKMPPMTPRNAPPKASRKTAPKNHKRPK